MNQLLIGAAIPFSIGMVVYLTHKCRASFRMLTIMPLCMTISMLWAVAPDLPRLIGMNDLYHRLANDPRCNIFYWHYSIDLVESESVLYLAGFVIISFIMFGIAWRELYLLENNK